ncbi:uncharacterized protein LOC136094147 [Hydra vulgaris]|uniref:uncharacterized protein LOC136094147 n=1 Tax=Hydra vulgaris TaxID=6087 RepID=UPI0032EA2244
MPMDRVDKAAYIHDLAYKHYLYKEHRNLADKMMLEQMDAIPNPTPPKQGSLQDLETIEKLKWTDELANELHKLVIKHFRKRKVLSNGIDDIWAADLVDMQAYSKFNNGIKYLLVVIDIFSKYGWIIPLKSKTAIEVAHAFNKIFKDRKCTNLAKAPKLWVDKGLEFYNKHVKALDEMVDQYNNTKHSSIKMTPAEASDIKNENIVWLNLNADYNNEEIQGTFYEQELQKTSQEIFRIEKVIKKQGNKSFVKWYGNPNTFNSWVDNTELKAI